MPVANAFLNIWGPALLVCFTVLIGLFYQNARLTDLRESFNKRLEDFKALMEERFNLVDERFRMVDERFRMVDERFNSIDRRFDDLRSYMAAEFKRVDERIDRLESPIVRK